MCGDSEQVIREKIASEIEPLLFETLGKVSMCWSETPQGVFLSDKAIEVGRELLAAIAGDGEK